MQRKHHLRESEKEINIEEIKLKLKSKYDYIEFGKQDYWFSRDTNKFRLMLEYFIN